MFWTIALMIALLNQAPPQVGVDELLDKLAGVQKQQAELKKSAEEITKEIQSKLEALKKRLEELGVTPPPPPKPPEPPAPIDPLLAKLQVAYKLDLGTPESKADALKDLTELYKQASSIALSPESTTVGQVVERLRTAARILSITGHDLVEVRKVIAGELSTEFPDDIPLNDIVRAKMVKVFQRIETQLTALLTSPK